MYGGRRSLFANESGRSRLSNKADINKDSRKYDSSLERRRISRGTLITQGVAQAQLLTALCQAPLHGLARIIQSEQSEVWGGLIDVEDSAFPLQVLKYFHGADVIRVQGSVGRIAHLRLLPSEKLWGYNQQAQLHPRAKGTYLITGDLGALGLEVATWMVEKGARRIVLVSRRGLPARIQWHTRPDVPEIQKILQLESIGAMVYPASMDMAASDLAAKLRHIVD